MIQTLGAVLVDDVCNSGGRIKIVIHFPTFYLTLNLKFHNNHYMNKAPFILI